MGGGIKSFEAWQKAVHPSIQNDSSWKFQVYPKALFAYELAWEDCEYLLKDKRGREVAAQLIRSIGAISAKCWLPISQDNAIMNKSEQPSDPPAGLQTCRLADLRTCIPAHLHALKAIHV